MPNQQKLSSVSLFDLSIAADYGELTAKKNAMLSFAYTIRKSFEHLPTPRKNSSSEPLSDELNRALENKRSDLLLKLKKQVKKLAEESVTKKFINENSGNIHDFCSAVEGCLKFGLLYRPRRINAVPSTLHLINHLSKSNIDAKYVMNQMQQINNNLLFKSFSNFNLFGHSKGSTLMNNTNNNASTMSERSMSIFSTSNTNRNTNSRKTIEAVNSKFAWIRIALFNRRLYKIIDYLILHASDYYERVSIMTHPSDSHIFADLLCGACTHNYTRFHSKDDALNEPSAFDLMQRQMIFSSRTINSCDKIPPHAPNTQFKTSRFIKRSSSSSSIMTHISGDTQASQFSQKTSKMWSSDFRDQISPMSLLNSVEFGQTSSNLLFSTIKPDSVQISNHNRPPSSLQTAGFSESPKSLTSMQSCTTPTTLNMSAAKDYVESLLQNEKFPLVYGKNNVTVQPHTFSQEISGYLSIHKFDQKTTNGLFLQWMPNGAMFKAQPSQSANDSDLSKSKLTSLRNNSQSFSDEYTSDKLNNFSYLQKTEVQTVAEYNKNKNHLANSLETGLLWEYALTIDLKQTPYLHCHRLSNNLKGGSVVFVHADGVPYPPLLFSSFNHVFNFLEALELNLYPEGQLHPLLNNAVSSTLNYGCNSFEYQRNIDSYNYQTLTNLSDSLPNSLNDYCFRIDFVNQSAKENFRMKKKYSSVNFRNFFDESSRFRIKNANSVDNMTFNSTMLDLVDIPVTNRSISATHSFGVTCTAMRYQILSRMFYGWLTYCRSINLIRKRLTDVVYPQYIFRNVPPPFTTPMSLEYWQKCRSERSKANIRKIYGRIYFDGCDPAIRKQVWPFLLEHYPWSATDDEISEIKEITLSTYKRSVSEWSTVYEIIQQRQKSCEENEFYNSETPIEKSPFGSIPSNRFTFESNDKKKKFNNGSNDSVKQQISNLISFPKSNMNNEDRKSPLELVKSNSNSSVSLASENNDILEGSTPEIASKSSKFNLCDCCGSPVSASDNHNKYNLENRRCVAVEKPLSIRGIGSSTDNNTDAISCSPEVLEAFGVNIYRIDKDVARCDRNHPYFIKGVNESNGVAIEKSGSLNISALNSSANLYRLRTIMCTWTWQHLEIGYVQGMCDILAPLLIVLEDAPLTYACFNKLMQIMLPNFPLAEPSTPGVVSLDLLEPVSISIPNRELFRFTRPCLNWQCSPNSSIESKNNFISHHQWCSNSLEFSKNFYTSSTFVNENIDKRFKKLRDLIKVLDPVLAKHMNLSKENSHLYFYRWLLLDFKREIKYEDVFLVWETIWSTRRIVSSDFGIFIAFALIQCYRDIIIFYCVDYTDIIRFYNERVEMHDMPRLLAFARGLVYRLQVLLASSES